MQQTTPIPPNALLRVKQIIPHIIPIGRSTWYAGVASGRFPQPIKVGPRLAMWRAEDIQKLVQEGAQ